MNKRIILMVCIVAVMASCSKSSFLDTRPDNALVVPASIEDLQALLDNDGVMNGANGIGVVPSLGEVACTDYYINGDDLYGFISPLESNAYTWEKQVFNGEHILDWNLPYKAILYANTALEGLDKITVTDANRDAWNTVKGSALFYRAFMYWQLAQVFMQPYDSVTADTDAGIPLKMSADINEPVVRASAADTYEQIVHDLNLCKTLLPDKALYATRPSKTAAHALLARVYMGMYRYAEAMQEADSALQLEPALIDYNAIDTTVAFPFEPLNLETIFYALSIYRVITVPNYAMTDTLLYNSYSDSDLRKKVYFSAFAPGKITFSGSYGKYNLFAGIATDELYLTRAECAARLGNDAGALEDLNGLLAKRYRSGSFVPYTKDNTTDVLGLILAERHKELVMRGLYFSDLRRLNKEGMYTRVLSRTVHGVQYVLAPNDPRYTYPIPDEVIQLHPGMQQNQR